MNRVEILEDADTMPNIKLDMADTYDPYSYQDDEPTVKIQVPSFSPQVVVEENRYPGIGLTMAIAFGCAVWFLPLYYALVYVIAR